VVRFRVNDRVKVMVSIRVRVRFRDRLELKPWINEPWDYQKMEQKVFGHIWYIGHLSKRYPHFTVANM